MEDNIVKLRSRAAKAIFDVCL